MDITTRNSERKHRTGFNDAGLIPKLNNIVYYPAKVTTRQNLERNFNRRLEEKKTPL